VFNDHKLKGVKLIELQADEIRTFAGTKKILIWIFVAIEVWSRLWIFKVLATAIIAVITQSLLR
jgi:hypothetical protein